MQIFCHKYWDLFIRVFAHLKPYIFNDKVIYIIEILSGKWVFSNIIVYSISRVK